MISNDERNIDPHFFVGKKYYFLRKDMVEMFSKIKSFMTNSKMFLKAKIAAASATLFAVLPAVVVDAAKTTGKATSGSAAQKILKANGGNGVDANTFADMIMKFVDPLQAIATACLICVAVVLGLKIGAASVAGDPRSRTSSIVGLFFVVIGEFIILNAGAVVAIVNNIG